MILPDFQQNLTQPLRQSTLAFLLTDNHILLAMKKRGFGKGKWNGVGGKPQDSETIEQTARREIGEEIGVVASTLDKKAILRFFFKGDPGSNQEVHTFFVDTWQGEPCETEEMMPQWFTKDNIPFVQMWPDDKLWLPLVLEGKLLRASFLFDEDGAICDSKIEEVSDLM